MSSKREVSSGTFDINSALAKPAQENNAVNNAAFNNFIAAPKLGS
jgi:hypothetical protein